MEEDKKWIGKVEYQQKTIETLELNIENDLISFLSCDRQQKESVVTQILEHNGVRQ